MLTELWTGISGKLSERLAALLLSPALAFWLVGAGAWLLDHGGVAGWRAVADRRLGGLADAPGPVQIAAAVAALGVLVVSGQVVDWFALPVLRLLEGYWPPPLAALGRRRSARIAARRTAIAARWRDLQLRAPELDPAESAEAIRLDRRLRRLPLLATQTMPTRLGNVLRSGESRPVRKYGLDPVVCWPQLWLLLPDQVRAEVTAARTRLNTAATSVLWGVLLLVWTPWSWWALPLAAAVAAAGYTAAVRAAGAYVDLVEAAWDLHRADLYRALRWPLPPDPAGEHAAGRAVTTYLRRGARGATPTFT